VQSVILGLLGCAISGVEDVSRSIAFYPERLGFKLDHIEEIAGEMRDREVRRMIIVDRKQKLAGVISVGDIAKVHGEEKSLA
jgi:CBS domain